MTKTHCSNVWLFLIMLLFASQQVYSEAQSFRDHAEDLVKKQICSGDENVDVYLSRKSRHSKPDLGWRVFATADGGFDVERAFMVSKGMEIHYRWHVSNQSAIRPANKRAEELCF